MSQDWQREFNLGKCKVLHFGKLNHGRSCTVNGRDLESGVKQRDLGVQVHNSLKMVTPVGR